MTSLSAGGFLPISYGIIIGSVHKSVQNLASAIYCVAFNIVAGALAPILAGSVMDDYKSQRTGMIAGYRVVLYAAFIYPVVFFLARIILTRYLKYKDSQQNNQISQF